MCGRYVLSDTIKVKQEHSFNVSASYNIAPSHEVLVLNPNPILMKWSYSPKWKLDMNLINCRSETLTEKPSFRGALRCIFVANGWYEWKRTNKQKVPYFHHCGEDLIYFAGIYNLESGCAVVTRESHSNISHVHHRQPVVLEESQFDEWFKGKSIYSSNKLSQISCYPVSKDVNTPKNNHSSLLDKVSFLEE